MKQLLTKKKSNYNKSWKSILFLMVLMVVVALPGRLSKLLEIKTAEAQGIPQLKQQLEELENQKKEIEKKLEIKVEVEKKISNSPKPKAVALKKALEKWGVDHIQAFEDLIGNKESGFNPLAKNPTSGACGMFQALPCSKMKCELWDIDCQAEWGVTYISQRYETPTNALKFWLAQKEKTGHGWY